MTPERWQRVYSLFEEALDQAAEVRSAWLQERSSHDPEALAEVLRLLELGESPSAFLETSAPTLLGFRGDARAVFDPGDLIANRYVIRRLIGKGGMGEVYEAFDQEVQVQIALKTVHLRRLDDPAAQERLRQEALIAREITHRNVCRIHDLTRHTLDARFGDLLVLAMEFLDGITLSEFLATNRTVEMSEAMSIATQLCEGLGAAHARGIIHRDLKAANIILARDGASLRVVITDFGLSRRKTQLAGQSFEGSVHGLFGTPEYMAPECLSGAHASVATDIYALGVTLFELVTGQKPFPPATSLKELISRQDQPAPAIRSFRPGIPLQWDLAIRMCLDLDATRRPIDSATVIGLLRGTIKPPNEATGRRGAIVLATVIAASSAIGYGFLHSRTVPVVLWPIENRSGDPVLNYLANGVTVELRRELGAAPGIQLLSPPEAGGLLRPIGQTTFSLTGSLQPDSSAVLSVKNSRSDAVVWTERTPAIAGRDAGRLRAAVLESAWRGLKQSSGRRLRTASLFGSDPAPGTTALTSSSEALEEYFQAIFLLRSRKLDDTLAAIQNLERALGEDPHFALAYAALAEAQIGLMETSYRPAVELMLAGHSYADRAVREGSEFAETHLVQAAFRQMVWDWDGSRASYREVFRLQPNSSRGHAWYAGLLLQFSASEEVLALSRRAFELDPFDQIIRNSHSLCLFFCGRHEEAIRIQEEAVRLNQSLAAHHQLGNIHAYLGSIGPSPERAWHFRTALEHAAAVERAETKSAQVAQAGMRNSDRMYSLFHALAGNIGEAVKYISRLESNIEDGRVSPAAIARAYAAMGQQEKAMDLIEMAMGRKDRVLMYIRTNPFFRSLQSNPRYEAVLRTMQL